MELVNDNIEFCKNKHIKYSLRILQCLPQSCDSQDSTKVVIAFFAISTLDLLDALEALEKNKEHYINWIYSLQVVPDSEGLNASKCGFRGSFSCCVPSSDVENEYFDNPHITMTYICLCCLLILGDDLSRVDKESVILSLKELQLDDGSYRTTYNESENDMRFIYCAACICYILQDWRGMNIPKAVKYIQQSITFEGGIAQGPGLEAHGGSTFCAVASLTLMGQLESALTQQQIKSLRRWCIFRQVGGFQGRPNKPTDTCYSFWVGATLKLIDSYSFINQQELQYFILAAQDPIVGGISKYIYHNPDPLHTYLAISGLSLTESDELLPVNPALNISQRAVSYLKELHKQWLKRS